MFRKRSGLSQCEMAVLLGGKSGSKIARYELGHRVPAFETLLAYEIAFQVALDELFEGRHVAARRRIRRRAARLMRTLDARPYTPRVKQKLDFLVELVGPLRPKSAP